MAGDHRVTVLRVRGFRSRTQDRASGRHQSPRRLPVPLAGNLALLSSYGLLTWLSSQFSSADRAWPTGVASRQDRRQVQRILAYRLLWRNWLCLACAIHRHPAKSTGYFVWSTHQIFLSYPSNGAGKRRVWRRTTGAQRHYQANIFYGSVATAKADRHLVSEICS